MQSHDQYKEMLVAHALNALEAAEARAVEDHLRKCSDCRDELAAWHEISASLAFAADATSPSTALRTRILQQARTHENHKTLSQEILAETRSSDGSIATSNVISFSPESRRPWSSVQTYGAIAAALIIAVLLIAFVVTWKRNSAYEAEIGRLSRQVNESQQELARLREEKGLLTAPDVRVTSLAGTDMAKDARAMLAFNHKTGRAMLVANGLPATPAGMTYQLWFIANGKPPMPGGVFTTDVTGHAELHDMIPPEGRNANLFAVTLERAGGVPAPEGKAYLQGNAS